MTPRSPSTSQASLLRYGYGELLQECHKGAFCQMRSEEGSVPITSRMVTTKSLASLSAT